jgi:diguanylate cyclase (GGDEF)-like protein/PAS domain S-box-containing protein
MAGENDDRQDDGGLGTSRSAARAGSFFDLSGGLVCEADFGGHFTRVGAGWGPALGYSASELLEQPFADFVHPDDVDGTMVVYDALMTGKPVVDFENRYRAKDGDYRWLRWSATADLENRRISALAIDITAQKLFEAEVARQALRDELTGLPTRAVFLDRVDRALAHLERHSSALAVVLLDLNDFGAVNDTLGRATGDNWLCESARRLERAVRASDTVARVGADEFGVLCVDSDAHSATEIAERLAAVVAEPVVISGRALVQTASSGVAVAETPRMGEMLVADAELALHRAMEGDAQHLAIFDREFRTQSVRRMQLREGLRHASERGELELAYQPIVGLADGRAHALEALVRWRHPELGLLNPGEFIALAEQSGLIIGLGTWVLRTACEEATGWRGGEGEPPGVAVNVSPHQLADPDFLYTVALALEASGLDPGRLWLEVTESAVLAHLDDTVETLSVLRALGVEIALDDFGEGYSSLSQLRVLTPISILKIGAPFVQVLEEDVLRSRAIVAAIITLARSLELPTVGEGVETAGQMRVLRALGCDSAQGVHLARPMGKDQLAEWLERP